MVEPVDVGIVVGGILVDAKISFDHVDVTFSRNPIMMANTVSGSGEMFWSGGVGSYNGEWNLGWQN
ncbi:MAG TPA: hypothetical protein VMU50_17290 [Polyangia bacterium]|nr:hypothetical protein [Polyangia bacterium]